MEPRYARVKGYRRPGLAGRPVYYIRMSREEIRERRLLAGVIATMAVLLSACILWVVSLI